MNIIICLDEYYYYIVYNMLMLWSVISVTY